MVEMKCLASPFAELRAQLRTSIPATLGMLLYKVPWLLSLAFVGRIGAKELAAAALATTLCNVTGMSLSVGLSSAITTLTAQARGQLIAQAEAMRKESVWRGKRRWGKYGQEINGDLSTAGPLPPPLGEVVIGGDVSLADETSALITTSVPEDDTHVSEHSEHFDTDSPILPLVFLYRGIFIQLAFVLPVGAFWLSGIKPTLLFLGQGEELSTMTESYLRILTFGLWGYSINWTLTAWLQTVELADIPAYAALVGGLLHVPVNLFFIHVVGLGWLGVGVATSVFQVIQPIFMLLYLKGTSHGRLRLLEQVGAKGVGRTHLSFWCEAKAAISSFSGLLEYLNLALPGVIAISEWWASEISIFLAGRLHPDPNIALGSMAVYQSLNSSCFMFPVGMSVGGSARIGNGLGAGNIDGARLASRVCVVSAGVLSVTLGAILYLTPHSTFPSFFTSNADLIEMTAKTIPLLSLYVVADGLQVALNAVIKGCGRQCALVPIIIIAYWVTALPLAYHLTFVRSGGSTVCVEQSFCGVVGLVGGMTMGTWLHFILLAAYTCKLDLVSEAKRVKVRLSLEKERYFQ
eukprot:CAMPEP_0181061178 /NCGR_PEP_ID=MMETSP1070-20121207/22377_1 /TAXON_ID=265543 /ORGANISM="Minutocellus polymorphus, Strain NH13" /LENGTH=575 /DNA_ID=CAMNT_0023141105 /DNA_START=93 /DNA_END=1817 /DNA_ORIENTATION=+